eukprot:SAG22_NODE_496_length_9797_cov_4.177241_5_plen_122_part_00
MPDLQVIAVPCNQFGAQEPGSPEEIKSFVYGATANPRGLQISGGLKNMENFTLLEKSSIVGNQTHPIFKLVKDKFSGEPTWNFSELIIFGKDGGLMARHSTGHRAPIEGPMLEALCAAPKL